jgi:hypothetical protein
MKRLAKQFALRLEMKGTKPADPRQGLSNLPDARAAKDDLVRIVDESGRTPFHKSRSLLSIFPKLSEKDSRLQEVCQLHSGFIEYTGFSDDAVPTCSLFAAIALTIPRPDRLSMYARSRCARAALTQITPANVNGSSALTFHTGKPGSEAIPRWWAARCTRLRHAVSSPSTRDGCRSGIEAA